MGRKTGARRERGGRAGPSTSLSLPSTGWPGAESGESKDGAFAHPATLISARATRHSAPIRLNRCCSADRPRVLLCPGPCTCCSLCLKHSSTPFIWITLSGPSCLSFCWEASPAVKWAPLGTLCLPVLSPFSHSSLLSTHLSVCPLHQEPPESWAQCPV